MRPRRVSSVARFVRLVIEATCLVLCVRNSLADVHHYWRFPASVVYNEDQHVRFPVLTLCFPDGYVSHSRISSFRAHAVRFFDVGFNAGPVPRRGRTPDGKRKAAYLPVRSANLSTGLYYQPHDFIMYRDLMIDRL